jgi:hypothetical protein
MIALASLVVASPPGTAAGGYSGNLLIKGVGSVYAGPYGLVSQVTTSGGASTFAFEVQNTGTTQAQFNVRTITHTNRNCGSSAGCDPVAYTITTGPLSTKVVVGPNGFWTAPIKPGAVASYSLKITATAGSAVDDGFSVQLNLYDPTGALLNYGQATAFVKSTTGRFDFDQFVNGSGQSTLSAPASVYQYPYVTDPAIKSGQSSTFTVMLRNDSASPARMTYTFNNVDSSCSAYFAATVKNGLTNLTSAVTGSSGWTTPVLAHGKSLNLTVTIKYLGNGRACLGTGFGEWQSTTMDSVGYTGLMLLVVNLAAGSS